MKTRAVLDLMHIANGRVDLSRNPVDHDATCARAADPESGCSCRPTPWSRRVDAANPCGCPAGGTLDLDCPRHGDVRF